MGVFLRVCAGCAVLVVSGVAVGGGLLGSLGYKRAGDVGPAKDLLWVESALKRYYAGVDWDSGVPWRHRLSGQAEVATLSAQEVRGMLFEGKAGGFVPLLKDYWVVEGIREGSLDWTSRVCALIPEGSAASRALLLEGYRAGDGRQWTERGCGGVAPEGMKWHYKDVEARQGGFATKLGTGLKAVGVKESVPGASGVVAGARVLAGAQSWRFQVSAPEVWLGGICGQGVGGLTGSGSDPELLRGWQERCGQVDPEQVGQTRVVVGYEYVKPEVSRKGWQSSGCALFTGSELGAQQCEVVVQRSGGSTSLGWQAQWWSWGLRMVAVVEGVGWSQKDRSEELSRVAGQIGFVVR